jgi:hypothetical protein
MQLNDSDRVSTTEGLVWKCRRSMVIHLVPYVIGSADRQGVNWILAWPADGRKTSPNLGVENLHTCQPCCTVCTVHSILGHAVPIKPGCAVRQYV